VLRPVRHCLLLPARLTCFPRTSSRLCFTMSVAAIFVPGSCGPVPWGVQCTLRYGTLWLRKYPRSSWTRMTSVRLGHFRYLARSCGTSGVAVRIWGQLGQSDSAHGCARPTGWSSTPVAILEGMVYLPCSHNPAPHMFVHLWYPILPCHDVWNPGTHARTTGRNRST
jgi:hypothetical protein